MKRIIYTIVAMFCSFGIYAQNVNINDTLSKTIEIGHTVPGMTIRNIHNYRDSLGRLSDTAKISDFRGKILILDFWATWCSPCIAMIPKMDSLQKQFGSKIQFLSITYQQEKEVLPFLERFEQQNNKHYKLPTVIGDKDLHILFPHTALPHYVWIGADGKLIAITGFTEVTSENIQNIIDKQNVGLIQKKVELAKKYNSRKPLFKTSTIVGEARPIFQSILTKFNEQIAGGGSYQDIYNTDSIYERRITMYNVSMPRLYQIAAGNSNPFGWNRTVLKVKDISKLSSKAVGDPYREWLKNGNGYCYELVLPADRADRAYSIMKNDLDNYFIDYDVQIVDEDTDCLALQAIDGYDKIKSKGGQSRVSFGFTGCKIINRKYGLNLFVNQLSTVYMQSLSTPILNETNYSGFVDLQIDAPLNNTIALNKELEKYGLILRKVNKRIRMLVIKDNSKDSLELNSN